MNRTSLFFLFSFLFLFTASSLHAQKKRGVVSITDEKGNVSTGKMKKGKKTGEWRTVDKKGVRVRVDHYVKGHLGGVSVVFDSRGDTIEISHYLNDTLHGEWRGTPSKEELIKGNFVHGKKQGWWVSSQKSRYINRVDSIYLVDDQVQGVRKTYSGGRLHEVSYYVNNVQQGSDTMFSGNGTPQKISYWRNGQLDSVYREYTPGGELVRKSWYREGKNVKYDSLWQVQGEGKQVRSLYKVVRYSSDGVKTYEVNYRGQETVSVYQEGFWGNDGLLDSMVDHSTVGMVKRNYYYQDEPTDKKRLEYFQQRRFDEKGREICRGESRTYNRVGEWTWFDTTGRVTKKIDFNSYGTPKHYIAYYPNGKVKISGVCKGGSLTDSIRVYSSTGKELKSGTPAYDELMAAHFRMEPEVSYFRQNTDGELVTVMDGEVEDAAWEDGYDTGIIPVVDKPVDEPPVYSIADQMPVFPGDSLQRYLRNNIVYPAIEKEKGMTGTVYVGFIVRDDGSVTDVKIVKEVPGAPGFTKEAIRVVKAMPKWIPGKMNGRPVDVGMTIPVRFVL